MATYRTISSGRYDDKYTFDPREYTKYQLASEDPRSSRSAGVAYSSGIPSSKKKNKFEGAGTIIENKEEGFRDVYALFESRYRAGGDFQNGLFSFNLNTEGSSLTGGATGIIYPLDEIMEMELYPFTIPNAFITNQYTTAAYYQYHFKSVEIFVKEFNRQCVHNVAGDRHHFTFSTLADNHYIHLTPTMGKFVFSGPTRADTITFQFLHRGYNLEFASDKYLGATVGFVNPASFTTTTPHGLTTNSCVVFPTFSGSVSMDSAMQNKFGHIVTIVNPTTFTIPLSLIGQGPNPVTTNFEVLERFIELPMRFRTYMPEITNHITPV
jgi:hypothetical protein